ncbi:MAG: hypothetical protein OXG24_11915 [Gammaproteobacteria bacterium]|nr:hypothetical protein [Gammaproteobacteria bacterium]
MTVQIKKKLKESRAYLIGTAIGVCLTTLIVFIYLVVDSSQDFQNEARFFEFTAEWKPTLDEDESVQLYSFVTDSAAVANLLDSTGSSAFETELFLYTIALYFGVGELTSLVETSAKIENTLGREKLQEVLGRRLAAADPRLALTKIALLPATQQATFIEGLFREWSYKNLDDALESLEELDQSNLNVAIQTILRTRSDLPDIDRQRIAAVTGNELSTLRMTSHEKASELSNDPGLAWRAITTDELHDIYQLEEIVQITERWVEKEGVEILSRLYSKDETGTNQEVLNNVVAAISAFDPEAAFEYVLGLSEFDRYKLSAVLAEWAESNPHEAIEALSRLDLDMLSHQIFEGFIRIWAKRDPYKVLEHIEKFPKRLQLKVAGSVLGLVVQVSPSDAVKSLEQLSSTFEDTSSIESGMVVQWARIDPKRAYEWVMDESRAKHPLRAQMVDTVVLELINVDPKLAFEAALIEPLKEFGGGLEQEVIKQICFRGNVELAMELLPRVREGSRAGAFASVGMGLVNTAQTKRAIALGEELAEEYRPTYYETVGWMWARLKPLEMLTELDQLPERLKSDMSKVLVQTNKFDPVLSQEELEQAKTFLDEEDSKEVEIWESW